MRVAYDVVALGGDLSATLAATLLAKRGQHVLLAPGQRVSRTFRSGPHLLEFTPRWLSGLTRPLVRRVLAELELELFVQQRVTPFSPSLQLLLPRARIDVGAQDDLLLEQLEREVGLSTARGERLLFQLAMASRRVDLVLDPESVGAGEPHDDLPELHLPPVSTPVGLMLRGPVHSVSPLDPGELGPIPVARLFSSWRQGSGSLIGGLASLELALHEQILAAGGEILPGADTLGLLTAPDGTPRGVMLEGRPGTLLAQRFVLGLSPHKLCTGAMLGPRPELKCRDVGHRHVLHLRFRRGWLPGSMGQLLLFGSGDDAPVLGIVSDPTLTSDEVVLTLQGTLPLNGTARLVAAEQHMVHLVRQVVPFFADGIVEICSPHRDNHAPLAPVTAVVNPRSRVPGLPGLPLDLGTGNTALVHPLVLGALGTEGCFAAALGAANLLS